MARADERPKNVDRKFMSAFTAVNENGSWYLEDNLRAHTTDWEAVNRFEHMAKTPEVIATHSVGTGF